MSRRGTVWWVGLASAAAALWTAWLVFSEPGPVATVPAPGVVADPLEARAPGARAASGPPPGSPDGATPAGGPARRAQPATHPMDGGSPPLAASASVAAEALALTGAELSALQASLRTQLAACFEGAAARAPQGNGTLVLAFTLVRRQGFGRPQRPRIEADTAGDARFTRCLLEQVLEADFLVDGEDGEVEVRLPIALRGNSAAGTVPEAASAVPEAASASSAPGTRAGEVTPASTDTPPAEVAGEEDP